MIHQCSDGWPAPTSKASADEWHANGAASVVQAKPHLQLLEYLDPPGVLEHILANRGAELGVRIDDQDAIIHAVVGAHRADLVRITVWRFVICNGHTRPLLCDDRCDATAHHVKAVASVHDNLLVGTKEVALDVVDHDASSSCCRASSGRPASASANTSMCGLNTCLPCRRNASCIS